jgi:hypothetical protein
MAGGVMCRITGTRLLSQEIMRARQSIATAGSLQELIRTPFLTYVLSSI